jgi:DNA-binding XRE family transcriptional regulator
MRDLQGLRSVPLSTKQRALLVQKRSELGLSQTELGKKAGVTKLSIINIESGNHRPSPAVLEKVCRLLSLDCDVAIEVHLRNAGTVASNRVTSRVGMRQKSRNKRSTSKLK